MPKPLVGRWAVDPALLNFVKSDTAVLQNETHEGPVFKFPCGKPEAGAVVAVFHGFDVCKARGEKNHRPRAKVELRIKPFRDIAQLKTNADLKIGARDEAEPYKSFSLMHDNLFLYAEDGNPHAMCVGCGKRVPVANPKHECAILPPLAPPAVEWESA